MAKARNYRKEYLEYHGKPAQIKRRAGRNTARDIMEDLGRARRGDGLDVNHKDHNTRHNTVSNLEMMSVKLNRGKYRLRKRR